MKITVDYSVSFTDGYDEYELEDVNCETIEEWEDLSEEERRKRLQELINENPNCSPCMILESYKVD